MVKYLDNVLNIMKELKKKPYMQEFFKLNCAVLVDVNRFKNLLNHKERTAKRTKKFGKNIFHENILTRIDI